MGCSDMGARVVIAAALALALLVPPARAQAILQQQPDGSVMITPLNPQQPPWIILAAPAPYLPAYPPSYGQPYYNPNSPTRLRATLSNTGAAARPAACTAARISDALVPWRSGHGRRGSIHPRKPFSAQGPHQLTYRATSLAIRFVPPSYTAEFARPVRHRHHHAAAARQGVRSRHRRFVLGPLARGSPRHFRPRRPRDLTPSVA
jgi:hypothetical protein